MIKLYVVIAIGALCTVFYFYGQSVGNSKCKIQTFQEQIKETEKNNKQQRIINDKVYKTGVADIRGILRDKYTIAE